MTSGSTKSAAVEAPPQGAAGISQLKRMISRFVGDAEMARDSSLPFESREPREDATLLGCELLEGSVMTTRPVQARQSQFTAFLNGTQRSVPLAYVRGIPVIAGTAATVIRGRGSRGTVTWRMKRQNILCVPRERLGGFPAEDIPGGIRVIDVDGELDSAAPEASEHPMQRARRAHHVIQRARENLELQLAREWVSERAGENLLVDGGLSRLSFAAGERCLTGLVKGHRTLYLRDEEVETVLTMQAAQRSSAFVIASRNEPVASWYLRLRKERGADPLWGLVRVEVPRAVFSSDLADERSGWILGETSPLTLPDSRWDRLLYGIHDCEVFLAAVI